jgi:hypothetical protein
MLAKIALNIIASTKRSIFFGKISLGWVGASPLLLEQFNELLSHLNLLLLGSRCALLRQHVVPTHNGA